MNIFRRAARTLRSTLSDILTTYRWKRILSRLNLQLLSTLKPRKVFTVTNGKSLFVLKLTTQQGLFFLRDWLPHVQAHFENQLVFPELVACGEFSREKNWALTTWIDGDSLASIFDDRDPDSSTWGGRGVTQHHLDIFFRALTALSTLSLGPNTLREPIVTDYVLSGPRLQQRIYSYVHRLSSRGLLHLDQLHLILHWCEPLLVEPSDKQLLFTNGDFQFRNLVVLNDDRVGIIDWDTARFSHFEIEHCITYQTILLWANLAAQTALIHRSRNLFDWDDRIMHAYCVFNVLGRMVSYSRNPQLCHHFGTLLANLLRGVSWEETIGAHI
ncbi:phosphotransferase [Thermogutta sp.]|uniref:phosphotransferase n=1 Tax=Thermogutta sp. TaxID=1962930 RepID=UPI00344B3A31